MLIYSPFHDARKWQREGLRTRDGHVAHHLAQQIGAEQVVVANRPTCIAEWVRLRGQWRTAGQRLAGARNWNVTVGPTGSPTTDVLVPALGFRQGSFHRWLMSEYAGARYNEHIRESWPSGGRDAVLWLCHPFAAGMIDHWPGHRVVLDAFDNFAVHPELPLAVRNEVRERYARLCSDADQIAVNSIAMQSYLWTAYQRDTAVIPNGVDPDFFAGATPMPLPFERPIIGYAGKLGRRIDVQLLLDLAASLTKGTIVLAGQTLSREWMAPARSARRIQFVGDLHYGNLPGFLAATDVCIVPHRVGEGENHGDATKIYEYLAAGKPTITTAIEGTERFSDRVVVTRDKASFVDAVRAVGRNEQRPTGGLLPSETWSARTAALRALFRLET